MNRYTAACAVALAGAAIAITACDRKPAEPKTTAPSTGSPGAASAPPAVNAPPPASATPDGSKKDAPPPVQGQVDPRSQGQSKDFEHDKK